MSHRNPMLAKVHIARKELGLDEDTYRAVLARITGKSSSAGLRDHQLDAVLKEFRRLGWKPKAGTAKPPTAPPPNDAVAGKIRALWISCSHLGAVQDGSEGALRAFVLRQAKVDDLRFLRAQAAYKVAEALKKMAERAGVNWSEPAMVGADGRQYPVSPRSCVIRGQWRRLRALGCLTIPPEGDDDALNAWLQRHITNNRVHWTILVDDAADRAIARLGAWIREVLAKRAEVQADG